MYQLDDIISKHYIMAVLDDLLGSKKFMVGGWMNGGWAF